LYAVYALADLGFKPIYLRNRTKSKAEDVAASFPASFDIQIIEDLRTDDFSQGPPLAIVGTVPAKGLSLSGSDVSDTIKLSPDMLRHPIGGVAVEMACR
jgi:pentafunctional AROM polypeptide